MAIREIELSAGTLRYRDEGTGRPLVFVHGVLVNGRLWERLTPQLSGLRCIVPDWPLGGHSPAMRRDADLSIAGFGATDQ